MNVGVHPAIWRLWGANVGPSASLSWVFAGIACLLSGFAYMELSARLPTRGSCYTSYHGLGELWAVIGALMAFWRDTVLF